VQLLLRLRSDPEHAANSVLESKEGAQWALAHPVLLSTLTTIIHVAVMAGPAHKNTRRRGRRVGRSRGYGRVESAGPNGLDGGAGADSLTGGDGIGAGLDMTSQTQPFAADTVRRATPTDSDARGAGRGSSAIVLGSVWITPEGSRRATERLSLHFPPRITAVRHE